MTSDLEQNTVSINPEQKTTKTTPVYKLSIGNGLKPEKSDKLELPLKTMVCDLGYSPCKCQEFKKDDEKVRCGDTVHGRNRQLLECLTCKTPYKFRYNRLQYFAYLLFSYGPMLLAFCNLTVSSHIVDSYYPDLNFFMSILYTVPVFWITSYVPFIVLAVLQLVQDFVVLGVDKKHVAHFFNTLVWSFIVSPLIYLIICGIPTILIVQYNKPLPYAN